MKKKLFIALASTAVFLAIFVAQASAASACFIRFHDPELPEGLK